MFTSQVNHLMYSFVVKSKRKNQDADSTKYNLYGMKKIMGEHICIKIHNIDICKEQFYLCGSRRHTAYAHGNTRSHIAFLYCAYLFYKMPVCMPIHMQG